MQPVALGGDYALHSCREVPAQRLHVQSEAASERARACASVLEHHPPLQPVLGLPGMHESVRLFLDAVEGSESPAGAGTTRLASLYRLGLAAETSKRSGSWETVTYPASEGELPTT